MFNMLAALRSTSFEGIVGMLGISAKSFLLRLVCELPSSEALVILEALALARVGDFPQCGFKLQTFFVLVQYEHDLRPGSISASVRKTP